MFASLIRRKASASSDATDSAFESTTFTLSTAVPRPPERRTDERLTPMLRIAKLSSAFGEQLIRVRNVSAGGLMADIGEAPEIGSPVWVEMSSQKIPASIVWIREGTVGVKFEQNLDIGELLAGRKARHGFRPRPPRLDVECKASVRLGKTYYTVDVQDISLGGIKVAPIQEYCVGKKVVVMVESFHPIKGEVRWFSDRVAGIVFVQPLGFEELAEWVGKRLEMASLKVAYQKN